MKTIREEKVGKATLRIVDMGADFAGVILGGETTVAPIRGESAEVVWSALQQLQRQSMPGFFGFDGAERRFLEIFPAGFADPEYRRHERDYKLRAREYLLEALPLEAAINATADDCEAAMRAYSKTNLLSSFEQARTRELLRSSNGPAFVRAAAAIATGESGFGLAEIERIMSPFGQPSWPAATYLSFFWRPEDQMFLKPAVTVQFAERVGHPFAEVYSPRLDGKTYESLLDLAARTEGQIGQLECADRIDVQSFIWAVGKYDAKDAANIAHERSVSL